MATDDINVFGSLRDFIADQSMQAVERDRQKLEAIRAAQEQFTPTPAQSAYLSAIFAPGSGVVDAAGQFPEFPSSDVALIDAFSGDPMPSIAENIAAGGIDRYLFAPLQAVGVAGDAMYAANPFIAGLPKGIATLGAVARAAGKADKKGIKALRAGEIQQDINTFARDSEGFVSPSLEALIAKAPVNLKGKQISEWLSANANKGVKPKELEFLGVDEFIANNPNASVREVAEGVSQNKVEVGKNVYYHGGDTPEIDFEVTTPEFDPLDPDLLNYQYRVDDIKYALEQGNLDDLQYLADQFAANRMTPDEIASYGDEFTFEDLSKRVSRDYASGSSNETLDDVIEELARDEYFDEPYELIEAKSTGEIDASIPDNTFAFGNEGVGYQIFIGGERVDSPEIFSQTEAQIQLRNALQEGGDPLRLPGEEDLFTETRYKDFVDNSLPGGDNYREIVYTWKNAPYEHDVQDHFNELSQISHALVRDRKLADGSTSLHVDELQSDLHTQGKQAGYSTPELDMDDTIKLGKMSSGISTEFTKLKNRMLPKLENSGLDTNRLENIKTQIANAEELYAKSPQDRFSLIRMKDAKNEMEDAMRSVHDLANAPIEVVRENLKTFIPFDNAIKPALELAQAQSARVPNYPFKGDDWYKMSLKQLLKDAVEEGKDTISVSGSAPITARYSDKYEKFYKSLYDQKIPSEMKKLANKYGGKFEKGKLDIDDTFGSGTEKFLPQPETGLDRRRNLVEANIIRITPEMKQKILEEGLPSFRMGGSVNNFIAPEDINIFA